MKFEIDVADFWIEDGELEETLKNHIKRDVVAQISTNIKALVDKEITTALNAAMEEAIKPMINEQFAKYLAEGEIARNGQVTKLEDHMKSIFERNHGWDSPGEILAKLAKNFGDELKKRYDAIFANRIVLKLNEQGMLKEEVVNLLLTQPQ